MSSQEKSSSIAVRASWTSVALCLATVCLFGIYLIDDQLSSYDHTGQGVLKGFFPRAALSIAWLGAALTALSGLVSLLLIRKVDVETESVYGIVGRGVFGIITGLIGVLILWIVVGHVVVGF